MVVEAVTSYTDGHPPSYQPTQPLSFVEVVLFWRAYIQRLLSEAIGDNLYKLFALIIATMIGQIIT